MPRHTDEQDKSVKAGAAGSAPARSAPESEGSLVAIEMAIESALSEMKDGEGDDGPTAERLVSPEDDGTGSNEPIDLDFHDGEEPLVTDEEIEAAGPPPAPLFADEKPAEKPLDRLQSNGVTYEVILKVGEGGMAEVYKAKSVGARGVQKVVAIKRIKTEYAERKDFRKMFEEEAGISTQLEHRNIVNTHSFVQDADGLMLVMEYVEGVDLKAIIAMANKKGARLSPAFACYVGAELADALAYAHRKKNQDGRPLDLVHRDVSSANVKITPSGDVKLLDFGIARAEIEGREKTAALTIKGKTDYMSPEQAKSQPVDHRTDQWALGVLMAEMMTGVRVFRGPNERETWNRICRSTIEYIQGRLVGVPEQLQAIILRTLSYEPDARYPSCVELAQALRKYLAAQSQASDVFYGAEQAAEELEALEAMPEPDNATHASPGRAAASASPRPYFRESSRGQAGPSPNPQRTPVPSSGHTPPPPPRESSGPRTGSGLKSISVRLEDSSPGKQASASGVSQVGSIQAAEEDAADVAAAEAAPPKGRAFARPVLLAAAVLLVAVLGATALLRSGERSAQPPALELPDAQEKAVEAKTPAPKDEATAQASAPPAPAVLPTDVAVAPPSSGAADPKAAAPAETVAAAPGSAAQTRGPGQESVPRRRSSNRRAGAVERAVPVSPAALEEPGLEAPEDRDDVRVSTPAPPTVATQSPAPGTLGVPTGTRIAACSKERADPAAPGPFAAEVSEDVVVDGAVRVPKRSSLSCAATGGSGTRVVGTCDQLSFAGRRATFSGQLQGQDKRPGIQGPLETLTRLPVGTCFYVLVQSGF